MKHLPFPNVQERLKFDNLSSSIDFWYQIEIFKISEYNFNHYVDRYIPASIYFNSSYPNKHEYGFELVTSSMQ